MNSNRILVYVSLCILLTGSLGLSQAFSAPLEKIEPKARCPVCGMFVAKYSAWITQIHHSDGDIQLFDGVKDMMAYFFKPETYGKRNQTSINEIWVKDYYMLNWIDGRKAFYVVGSDVFGPMGHEFIPFSSQKTAASFKKDHRGKQILSFEEITERMVTSLQSGQSIH